MVQLDEPFLRTRQGTARACTIPATNHALDGRTIILGVLDFDDFALEGPGTMAEWMEGAFARVPPGRAIAAPDCGFTNVPRAVA